MKYLVIDDEHELYYAMMGELFTQKQYDVTQVPRMVMPLFLRKLYDVHYDRRINRRIKLPFKSVWTPFYRLHKYPFDPEQTYCVVFMNGSLREHFEVSYLLRLKRKHPNVKLAVLIFDHSSYPGAKRAIEMLPIFDYKFSFDQEDCKKFGMEHFYNCFSKPKEITQDPEKKSSAFFIGGAPGRLELLQNVFSKISAAVENCKFYIAGVQQQDCKPIPQVVYNQTMSFREEMEMQYNTQCIVEILRQAQKGVTLRTCEAVAFNKKLLTNNAELTKMPFYDPRYMKIFTGPDDIDLDFITSCQDVKYEDDQFFSPVRIIERLEQLSENEKK